MKRLALPLILLTTVACHDVTTPADLENPDFARSQADRGIPDHYIVVFNEGVGRVPSVANDMARQHAGRVLLTYQTALRGFSMRMSAQAAARLARDPRVAYVEPDQVVSLRFPQDPTMFAKPDRTGNSKKGGGDPCASAPNYESHSGLWGIWRVNGGVNGAGKTVWVIDTGIDSDHCDLTVGTHGADFTGSRKGWEDENGHGTHVAGTIGAKANGLGVVGVAAGATVEAVRVLDRRGSGRWSWVIAGIDYVAANASAGDVANMSLGGPASQAVDDAVLAAAEIGVRFALAAGNESDDASSHSPARANHPNIYTVSAFDSGNRFAGFSNFGNPPIDWTAPGVDVASTYKDNGYAMMSGTSMASPHVAGLLALGTFGSCGSVSGDPDGTADQMACR